MTIDANLISNQTGNQTMVNRATSMVYVPGLDVSFIWRRGNDYQEIIQGHWDKGGGRRSKDKVPTQKSFWVDNSDVYRELNEAIRQRWPAWFKNHGPVKPQMDNIVPPSPRPRRVLPHKPFPILPPDHRSTDFSNG